MKTYRIGFWDTDGCYNWKLLGADCENTVRDYMEAAGLKIDQLEEVQE